MKIDLGCGTNKKAGFIGIDCRKFDGVDVVCDIGKEKWPFADDSVEEAHASHCVEHLKPEERIHFANELHRVLKKGKGCLVIVPHWGSCRAYGDLTHQWPPVTEFWPPYLDAAWRKENAPHNDAYTCDFACTQPGYAPGPSLTGRSDEFRSFALSHYREAAADMLFTLIKK